MRISVFNALNIGALLYLAKVDFRQKYLGSYLGIIWAFIQPAVTIAIFWFVFQVGFKVQPVDGVPFLLWLIAGILPWFFFADSIVNATVSIVNNAYLVNKIVFKVEVLPLIKIFSALVIHLFFVMVMFLLFSVYDFSFSLYWLQVIYYLFCMLVLLVGLSWITSSIVVFMKDVQQLVTMFIQFGFWMTPIFWSIDILPEDYQQYIKLNPVYYIVEGYRDSLLNEVFFWEKMDYTIYFWVVTIALFVIGAIGFKRLRPHFADVL